MLKIHAVAAFTIALLLAAGCSTSKAPPSSKIDPPAPAEVTLIKVATPHAGDYVLTKLLIPAFLAEHENYQVEVVPFEEQQPMKEAARTGKVDLVYTQRFSRAEIQFLTIALERYLAKAGLDEAPYGGMLEGLRKDGRLYELPYDAGLGLFVYNVSLAQAAGVTIPTDGWTWDQFRAAAARLPQGVGDKKILGLDTDQHDLLAEIWIEGKTGRPVWQADLSTLREAIGLFYTMAFTDESMVPAPPWEITTYGYKVDYYRSYMEGLRTGKAAMAYEGSVTVSTLPHLLESLQWDVAPMPSVAGARPIIPVYPDTLGIALGSTKPDAAWEFLAFVSGQEGAAVLARAGFTPPYRSEETRKAWAENKVGYPPGVESIWSATWRVSSHTSLPPEEATHRYLEFQKAQNWALSGRKSVDEALAWFVTREDGK